MQEVCPRMNWKISTNSYRGRTQQLVHNWERKTIKSAPYSCLSTWRWTTCVKCCYLSWWWLSPWPTPVKISTMFILCRRLSFSCRQHSCCGMVSGGCAVSPLRIAMPSPEWRPVEWSTGWRVVRPFPGSPTLICLLHPQELDNVLHWPVLLIVGCPP